MKEYKNREEIEIEEGETEQDRSAKAGVVVFSKKRFIWFSALTITLITTVMGLVFIFTPLLSRLKIPVYGGYISRDLLIEKMQKMDSLEFEVTLWRYYNKNIRDIIDGNAPSVNTDSIRLVASSLSDSEIKKAYADTVLRQKVTSNRGFESVKRIHSYNLFPPINGSISTKFNQEEGRYGVEMRVNELTSVLAINDGTVVASYWSSNTGNVVYVQHSDNMLSVYSMLSQTNKAIGDNISAGEVIGYIGGEVRDIQNASTTNTDSFKLYFELWHNGNRVDPENYILF